MSTWTSDGAEQGPGALAPQAAEDPGLQEDLGEFWTRNLLEAPGAIVFFKDLQGRFIRVSPACAALTGRTPEELVGLTDFDLTDRAHALELLADEQRIIATGEPLIDKAEVDRLVDRPGTWVETSKFPLRDATGTIVGTFGASRDVTRQGRAEQEVARMAKAAADEHARLIVAEAQLRAVLNGSTDAIVKYDGDLRYRYVNPAGERARATTLEQLIGRTDRETGMDQGLLAMWEPALRAVLQTGEPDEIEFSARDLQGGEKWFHTTLSPDRDTTGALVGVLTSMRDITEIKRAEQALAHHAMHDSLTGLANRHLLTDRLGQALVRMERAGNRLAVFFVDLDRFKDVNDTYGHEVGDSVLIEVARRLERAGRRTDTIARLGGDEFIVLCEQVPTADDVEQVADRIVHAMAEPFEVGTLTLRLSASVGAVVTDDPGTDASSLLRNADSAMYRAKEGGRNRFEIFDPLAPIEAAEGSAIEAELRLALENKEFRLVYQPRLSLAEQHVLGFEALIRWEHPRRGTLSPADFLAVAEARGLIVRIGAWVLDTACEQLAAWTADRDPNIASLTMSVNVSGRELRERHFVDLVRSTLEQHGLAPGQLCLEVSERALVYDGPDSRRTLEALAALGVQLAVDDFGATYTSLTRLPKFPVGVVKLEQLTVSSHERGIVAAVIAMAHGLGMSVVGGGIETVAQLNDLLDLACDDGQGFLLGRPLSIADVIQVIAADGATLRAEAATQHVSINN
ncbi:MULTISPECIES: bifunctional diguanylate cyclase/phosphodiesterase [unclassified Cryobacterium]|uniref:sensor domain-containing protein n=1 Tax=unclassified Cryobacterium TaxID=2649013 RepID=UPI00141BEC0E|nr:MULTISPECIES: bifunctional diguanylate cyclase/phosphodiesterase [unclassified Cryobacterium]